MNDSTLCWLWLSSLTEVSPNAKAALLKIFQTPQAAFQAPHGAFTGIEGLSKRDVQILEARDLTAARAIPDQCLAAGAFFLTPDDDAYPESLREIFAPPAALYVRGRLPDLDREVPVAVISITFSEGNSIFQLCCCPSFGFFSRTIRIVFGRFLFSLGSSAPETFFK